MHTRGYVYAGGEVIAQQERLTDGTSRLKWRHTNPLTGDDLVTDSQGVALERTTVDPMGVSFGDSDPFTPVGGGTGGDSGGMSSSAINAKVAQLIPGFGAPVVKLDGFITSPHLAFGAMSTGAARLGKAPTAVWAGGRWNFVRYDPGSGQNVARVFSHYDYTSVTSYDGRTSGAWHPVFDSIVVTSSSPEFLELPQKTRFDEARVKQAVNACFEEKFNMTVTRFETANRKKGQAGSIILKTTDGRVLPSGFQGFGIVTDVTTMDYKKMKSDFPSYAAAPAFTPSKASTGPGTGIQYNPLENYILTDWEKHFPNMLPLPANQHPLSHLIGASDLAMQVHEAGNSAAIHLKRNIGRFWMPDPDSGEGFETCVADKLKSGR